MAGVRAGIKMVARRGGRRGLLAGVMLATAGLLTRAGERVAQAAPISGDSNNAVPGVTAVNTSTNIALAAVSGQPAPPGLGGPQPTLYAFQNNVNQKAIRAARSGASRSASRGWAASTACSDSASGRTE